MAAILVFVGISVGRLESQHNAGLQSAPLPSPSQPKGGYNYDQYPSPNSGQSEAGGTERTARVPTTASPQTAQPGSGTSPRAIDPTCVTANGGATPGVGMPNEYRQPMQSIEAKAIVSQQEAETIGRRGWLAELTVKNNSQQSTGMLIVFVHFDDHSLCSLLPRDGTIDQNGILKLAPLESTQVSPGESKHLLFFGDDTSPNDSKKPTYVSINSKLGEFQVPAGG